MVYSCIAKGDGYTLDYYSTDMIDLNALASKRRVQLRSPLSANVAPPQPHYDFWVFNWHFYTMAIDLDPSVIAALAGPKFTVVLELAPGDPLQLVPAGVFDAYIALDPGAIANGSIYPFPRPLDGDPRVTPVTPRDVPVIGSFGFATPGKGFENIVQAVNEEFDRAIVRVNIPAGDHIGSSVIHARDYARHIGDMCRGIAKPGIDVRFSYDFMTADQLIEWCAYNDLNCFMYTRCQPGLSATTDQAIISGRPLLTSSNDTFRHIHQYIAPYPLTSLREAIATTTPMVQAMQRDWSKAAFNARFATMLEDYGVLNSKQVPAQSTTGGPGGYHEVLIATTAAQSRGVLDRPLRIANALQRTGQYHVECFRYADLEALAADAEAKAPDALIVTEFAGADAAKIEDGLASFTGPILHIGSAGAIPEEESRPGKVVALSGLPVIPYYTVTNPLDEIPTIWLLGFTSGEGVLLNMLRRAARELPGTRIRVQLLPETTSEEAVTINKAIAEVSGLCAETHMPAPAGDAVIDTFATAQLIIVRNVEGYSDQLQNQAELAMITERAVVFTREAPFSAFSGREIFVEDHGLSKLVELGVSAQIKLVQDFAEGQAFAKMHRALAPALAQVPTRTPKMTDVPKPDENVLFLQRAFQVHLGRAPDPVGLQHYLERLNANVSRGRIERGLRRSPEAKAYREAQKARAASGRHVRNLLAMDDEEFVKRTYEEVLGRRADPVGLAHHLHLLRSGEMKEAIISGLFRSPEASQAFATLPGLVDLVRRHERSRSGLRALLSRNRRRRRVSIARSLNIVEHRLYGLVARVEAATQERATLQTPTSQKQALEGPLKAVPQLWDASPVTITVPRTNSATLYVVAGATGATGRFASSYTFELVRSCLAEGRPVRMVEWNLVTKRLQFVSQAMLNADPWKDLRDLPLAEHPPHDGVSIVVDKSSINEADWLLVPDCLRQPGDPEIIMEVDIILEARRIGLQNTFVFHGAGVLRQAAADEGAVAAQDQYMQAMLLADGIVATSDLALSEIEHYFSAYQYADFAPHLAMVPLPAAQDGKDWPEHVRGLFAALDQAGCEAPFIICHILAERQAATAEDGAGGARTLQATLGRLGIDAREAEWDGGSLQLRLNGAAGGLLASGGRGVRTPWLIVTETAGHQNLAEIVDAAHENGLCVAIMLSAQSVPDAAATPSDLVVCLSRADKIICDTDAVATRIWHALLATRLKFASAEDRIAVAELPRSLDASSSFDNYAKRIGSLLAHDRPGSRVVPLARKEFETACVLMPQLKPRPKLSLCISTYNRSKWLRASLENIFRQVPEVRDNLEVLVVDNCSVDNTPEVGRQFSHRADFSYVRNPVNVGLLGNLAVTAQRARGDYVWILGDDDLTRQGVIKNILSLLGSHPQLELVYMNYGYTSESTPDQVEDLDKFLDQFNVLQPACPDELGTVAGIAAKTENFYTAIYSHVYRRDHALRAYCQDTSGRIFSTMRACIPTAYYVLHYMAGVPAYWIGEQALIVNSNVSWAAYGALLDLEHLPSAWDLAERMGCPAEQVDIRRANRLWLVELMWREMFENDKAGNSSYISVRRVIMRLRHLPEFEKHAPELRRIYTTAHETGNPAAALAPSILFGAF